MSTTRLYCPMCHTTATVASDMRGKAVACETCRRPMQFLSDDEPNPTPPALEPPPLPVRSSRVESSTVQRSGNARLATKVVLASVAVGCFVLMTGTIVILVYQFTKSNNALSDSTLITEASDFDPADVEKSLVWWVNDRNKAPYPLAEDTGNAIANKTLTDWEKERNARMAKQTIAWRVTLDHINNLGYGAIQKKNVTSAQPEQWQFKWRGRMRSDYFRSHDFIFDSPIHPEGIRLDKPSYPIPNREWAKTLRAGDAVLLKGNVQISYVWPSEDAYPQAIRWHIYVSNAAIHPLP